jgi:DNA helicase-2/ATP-dependent DNA helicase PcrA
MNLSDQANSYAYLERLNPAQREAVEAMDGPVLVLAGAGTGKTSVLTARLAHLLNTGRCRPHQILAVTFTNKAAQEMRERVARILGGAAVDGWWLGTFHSLAARMLRRHAELVGLQSNFTILDPDDQQRLIKQVMETYQIDVKKSPPKQVIAQIDRWKDKALNPQDVSQDDVGDIADGKGLILYRDYQARLRAINACDFGDLLLHMITILRDPKHKNVLDEYHRQFKYMMVDEYQDTNVAQYMWLRLLAMGSQNICCVGDDDQSIYGWRGAEVGNILRFEHDFPGAKIIRLEQNYRSTGNILAAASGVISHNQGRLGKTLWSEGDKGELIRVRGLWDSDAEARWIAEEVEQLQHAKFDLNEISILVRASAQMRVIEERFMKLNIPLRVIGGQPFYARMEIRDMIAYLRVVMQPADDLALERIINVPKRAIGDSTVSKLYSFARAQNISLYDSLLQLAQTDELRPAVRKTLTELEHKFSEWRALAAQVRPSDLVAQIMTETGYLDFWKKEKTLESETRVENLRELVSAMAEYTSIDEFLEHVALVMDNQDMANNEKVSIMTLHAAKGLEFDAVFLPGWEEGLFPSQRSMDDSGMKGLEEERRLAYVGITRARKRAYITYVANRMMYGRWENAMPSRFIDEVPAELKDLESDKTIYGTGRSSHWDSSGVAVRPQVYSGSRASVSTERHLMNDDGSVLKTGMWVEHNSFGRGKIVHIDGQKLDIQFQKGGMKRVMASFVEAVDE